MKKGMKINKDHFRVAIFGSARLKPSNRDYKLVYNLAKLIAKENFDIVTGGGPGLMEAASKGHAAGRKNNDIHSIGLTIKLPMEQRDAVCLDIKKDFSKFSHRLDNFMKFSNVVVVAPGGIGTVLEFFYTWQLIQVKHIKEIPIIMLGSMWKGLLNWVKKQPLKNKLMSKEDLNSIFVVKNNKEAMEIIRKDFKK
jgi:uncharacterized protein (TIGR00730 family)